MAPGMCCVSVAACCWTKRSAASIYPEGIMTVIRAENDRETGDAELPWQETSIPAKDGSRIPVRFAKTLKDQNVWIVGLDQNAGQPIYGTDLTGAIGLVVGGEEKGIRPLVKRNCDFLISIPQCGPVGSLNASVAGAIAMYESHRQRLTRKNG